MVNPVRYIRNFLLNFIAPRSMLRSYGLKHYANPEKCKAALGKIDEHWRHRIDTAVASPDNAHFKHHERAGELDGGWVIMHNGLCTCALGYYGEGAFNLLAENRGVHEPQEERLFQEVLPFVKPGGTIVEMGANWSFYSLWFAHDVQDAKCFLIEPRLRFMASGIINFEENGKTADFTRAYIGGKPGWAHDGTRVIAVDDFCKKKNIDHISILHSDIQAAELDMLHGAVGMIDRRAIDFVFISTHSNDLHRDCQAFLVEHGYTIIAESDIDDSYSYDGLIVAKSPNTDGPGPVDHSLRTRDTASSE